MAVCSRNRPLTHPAASETEVARLSTPWVAVNQPKLTSPDLSLKDSWVDGSERAGPRLPGAGDRAKADEPARPTRPLVTVSVRARRVRPRRPPYGLWFAIWLRVLRRSRRAFRVEGPVNRVCRAFAGKEDGAALGRLASERPDEPQFPLRPYGVRASFRKEQEKNGRPKPPVLLRRQGISSYCHQKQRWSGFLAS